MAEIIIGFSVEPRYIRRPPFSLFESKVVEQDMVKEIPGAGIIRLRPIKVEKFAADSQTTQQVLEIALAVAAVTAPISIVAGIITNCLSAKLTGRAESKTKVFIHNTVNHVFYLGDVDDVDALREASEKALREQSEEE
jgi:hypothetical protein